MSYRLTAADITDELIKQTVTTDESVYLKDADKYLLNLLTGFDSTKVLIDIPDPLPYKVAELAKAHVCFSVCKDKFGGTQGVYFKGEQGGDRWYTKLKYYEKLVDALESDMSLDVLTGTTTQGSGYSNITLERA